MRREPIIWTAIAVTGFAIFAGMHEQAFPTAGIDLQVTRAEALQRAGQYLRETGFDTAGYRNTALFENDPIGLVYLQRELGLPQASALARSEVPLFFWSLRWFKPLHTGEYRVTVLPDGRIAGFSRRLPEDALGAHFEQGDALPVAREFLDRQNIDLQEFSTVEAHTEKRSERTDHTFVWRKTGFDAVSAELRLRVVVQGDRVGEFETFLKVPEEFERAHAREHATGALLTVVAAFLLTLLLAIAALVVFMRAYKGGELRWKFAAGFAAGLLVLLIAATVNTLPAMDYQYQTEMAYGVHAGLLLAITAVIAVMLGIWLLINGGAGEYLARYDCPHTLRTLQDLLARRFTRELAASSLRGYALAFGFVGYLVLFYLVAGRFFGAWMPAEGPYTNMLNTAAPFLYPLLAGLTAALTEEFAYRLFAIPFLKRYLRWTFLALLVPAMIWAFAHSSYAVSPVYLRAVELTIAGIAFGYCFLRYDLWTVLVAHYVVNALLVGWPLLQSGNAYFQISGLAVILLGLLPALAAAPALVRVQRSTGNVS